MDVWSQTDNLRKEHTWKFKIGKMKLDLMPKSWLSARMPNRNTEAEFWRKKKKSSYILCQAKREHSRLAPPELCPGESGEVLQVGLSVWDR